MRVLRQIRNLSYRNFGYEYLFKEQYAYGHREILLAAADLASETPIYGRVQHGWDPLLTDPARPFIPNGFREAWQWVWAAENVVVGRARGIKKVRAIGAPWLYLLDSLQIPIYKPSHNRQVGKHLLMPSHINEMSSVPFHSRQIAQALSYAPAESWTVMLHGLDFMTKAIRDLYTNAGLIVTTAGWPVITQGTRHPSSPIGDRLNYLRNIVEVMSGVELLLTDDIGTHVLYASSLGLDVLIKPISLRDMFEHSPEVVEDVVKQGGLLREWVEASTVYSSKSIVKPRDAIEITSQLLGLESKLSQEELRAALLAK